MNLIRSIQCRTALALVAAAAALGCTAEIGDVSAADESLGQETEALTAAQRETMINTKAAANQPLVGNPTTGFTHFEGLAAGARRDYSGGNGHMSIFLGDAVNRAHIVMGLIRVAYLSVNDRLGSLGFPTTDELLNGAGTGRYNLFERGRILWKIGAPGAFETSGVTDQQYSRLGFEWGTMGFPTSNRTSVAPPKVKNHFESGRIYSASGIAWPVLTRHNPDAKLEQMNWPRLTSASIRGIGVVGKGCITASGAGFTPGQTVIVGHSNSNSVVAGNKTAVVQANGTFSIVESCTTDIQATGSITTVVAVTTADSLVRAANAVFFGGAFTDPLP